MGVARSRSYLAPPDTVYVGLLFLAPLVSAAALVVGYRQALREEPMATLAAGTLLVNAALLGFVIWLFAALPASARREQALWIVLLFAAPFANAAAVLSGRR